MARPTAPRLLTLDSLEPRTVPAVVSGVVYSDLDGNGTQNALVGNSNTNVLEPGAPGVVVQLDPGPNGTAAATATTDASGTYTFGKVPVGPHTIAAVAGVGAAVSGSQGVTVGNDPVTAVPIAVKPSGIVKGVVFADLNADGKQAASEPGVAGVLVQAGTFSATTDATGSYQFTNVPDGVVTVTATPPANTQLTNPDGTQVQVANGTSAAPALIGVKPTTGLGGRVTLAASPDAGLSGLTVRLDPAADGKATTGSLSTTTDATGNYLFSNVPAGPHTITVDAPTGATLVTADGSGKVTATVALPVGVPGGTAQTGVQTGLDIGVKYAGSVTSTLYVDANGNGTRDATEPTQFPAKVELELAGSGKAVSVVAVNNPGDGSFVVAGLPDGTHTLTVTPAAGSTVGGPNRTTFTVTNGSAAVVDPIKVQGTGTTPTGTGTPGGVTTPPAGTGGTLALGSGSGPNAVVYSFATAADGKLTATAGAPIIRGGFSDTRAMTADFTGDGTADTVTATGAGEASMVRVYDGKTGTELVEFAAFEASFTGGVNLAAGDFNGDGKADIVVSADTGGGPRVRVFDAAQYQAGADPAKGRLLADFFGIADTKFRGGARVAVGDLNHDGTADLVVSAGQGGGPRVAIYDGKMIAPGKSPTRLVADFFAFEPKLRNGAVVSVGDINGDGFADLVAGAGPGGAPRVVAFSGQGIMANSGAAAARIADFYVNGDAASRAGTTVTVKDLDKDGKADIVATDGSKAFVFTSTSISRQFVNPQPAGPASAAEIEAFGADVGKVNVG